MYLKHLHLYHYRNYENQELDLNPGINVLIGENGQGKTNLLEAVYYLSNGNNFRGNKDPELIQWENPYFRIIGELKKEQSQRLYQLDLYYDKEKNKQLKINEVKYKSMSELQNYLKVVLFSPDDLKIVKESPSVRRQYLDRGIVNFFVGYRRLLNQYEHILQQRNNLLKELQYHRRNLEQITVWNNYLVEYGSKIIYQRIQYLKKMIPIARKIQQELTLEKEKFTVTYHCSIGSIGDFSLEEIQSLYERIIQQKQEEEIFKGTTLWGPHRDDLIFYLNGMDLKKYGSQGQQRTAVLALKMAELQIFQKQNGEFPILLLDDVMSELDDSRRAYLLRMVKDNKIQTIITGANFDLLHGEISENEFFYIKEGKIINK